MLPQVLILVVDIQTAEKGGATTFSKANIFVRPKKLAVTFFAYKGPKGRFDTGLTEHSGCPVREGEKWIATAWLREGVTTERTWEHYDPSGIPLIEDYIEDSEAEGVVLEDAESASTHDEL